MSIDEFEAKHPADNDETHVWFKQKARKEQNCNEEETADNRGLNTRGRLPCQQPETITIWLGIDGNTAEERDQKPMANVSIARSWCRSRTIP